MKILTQGGQTSIHSIRMNLSVIRFILKFFLIIFIISLSIKTYKFTNKSDLANLHNYYQAKIISLYQKDLNHQININKNNQRIKSSLRNILNDYSNIRSKEVIISSFKKSLNFSLIISTIGSLILIIYFITRGRSLNQNKHLRGGNISTTKELIKSVKNYNRKVLFIPNLINRTKNFTNIIHNSKSDNNNNKIYKPYYITKNIPYPAHTETQHTIITGGSGTGKTQMLKSLITQIRKNGDRAIIYDKMGSFVPSFFDKENYNDIILNPFDKRSPIWSIFNEVENNSSNSNIYFDSIACALMPITKNISDPFWTQAARTIFTSVASKLKEQGETSNQKLVDNLLKIDLSEIAKIVKGTPAGAIIDERSPKTALSVMSVLSTYLACLKYLKDEDLSKDSKNNNIFSIRNWVKNEQYTQNSDKKSDSSFLFISSKGDQHESLKPLISTWLEIAINSLLSLPQSHSRRIWIILDELPSLHMLPSLNSGIAQSRQFGGCFVLSLQLMAQLRSIYGKDDAETISGLAKTRVVFSSPDEETARWCSNSLGRKEQEITRQNLSYGANEVRDGISLNTQTTTENIIMPTQIMNLKNLECYIKLPFNFPITKTKIKIHKGKEIAQRFIEDMKNENEQIESKKKKAEEENNKDENELSSIKQSNIGNHAEEQEQQNYPKIYNNVEINPREIINGKNIENNFGKANSSENNSKNKEIENLKKDNNQQKNSNSLRKKSSFDFIED